MIMSSFQRGDWPMASVLCLSVVFCIRESEAMFDQVPDNFLMQYGHLSVTLISNVPSQPGD